MDFFKSVFSEDRDPSSDDEEQKSPQDLHQESTASDQNPKPTTSSGGTWNLGGLIKTLTPVIETYRRDLEEFGSGLKKETSIIREAASRAVKELPSSIEVGASVAQESIESVGHVIDEFGTSVWRGTSEIISSGLDPDSQSDSDVRSFNSSSNTKKHYSRFEMQIQAIQSDVNTYSEEADDLDDYAKWKAGFTLEEKGDEIADLLEENAAVEEIYNRMVPAVVDGDAFWSRYFYRVYKLKQVEDARANLVKRAISGEDEDLSWDVEDDDSNGSEVKNEEKIEFAAKSDLVDVNNQIKENVVESGEMVSESVDKSSPPRMIEHGESSSKGSEVPLGVGQSSGPEEEDIEWDEIEDIDGHDEKRVASSGSPNKTELRMRPSVTEDEDDLSWDIEDDDEPVKH